MPRSTTDLALPHVLSRGIDFICQTLCNTPEPMRGILLKLYEREVRDMPQHTLHVILSRGVGNTWTRKPTRGMEYTPFWYCEDMDESGINMWGHIEDKQYTIFGLQQLGLMIPDSFLETIEGRLDLWSPAIWDEERWLDIHISLLAPDPEWIALLHHMTPTLLRLMLNQRHAPNLV